MGAVVHYMGAQYCPECGEEYDPVTGYCAGCEGRLDLYRVQAFTQDWLNHSEEKPPEAPSRVVSRRKVTETVSAFLAYDPALIVIQRVD